MAPVLVACTVDSPRPASLFEPAGGLVKIELPMGMGRLKLLGGSEKVAGGLTGRAIELLGDGSPIDRRRKGPAHVVVAKKRMRHLDAAALAVHLGPGVRAIEIDVLDTGAGEH